MLDNYRFYRSCRLRKKADIQQVLRQGKRLYGTYFILCFRLNGLYQPRIGIVTSKKNIKLAVDRNRVKRLIREKFRLAKNQLKGFDIVIISRKQKDMAINRELFQCLDKLFNELKVF